MPFAFLFDSLCYDNLTNEEAFQGTMVSVLIKFPYPKNSLRFSCYKSLQLGSLDLFVWKNLLRNDQFILPKEPKKRNDFMENYI